MDLTIKIQSRKLSDNSMVYDLYVKNNQTNDELVFDCISEEQAISLANEMNKCSNVKWPY